MMGAMTEEDTRYFCIGCSNWSTNRALAYAIEGARVLCGGMNDALAVTLLQMAINDVEATSKASGAA